VRGSSGGYFTNPREALLGIREAVEALGGRRSLGRVNENFGGKR